MSIFDNPVVRVLFLLLGMLCVVLGFIGIFLPLFPTTPFLLAAAFLFSYSSDSFHRWLLKNRLFGPFIRAYQQGEGVPRGHKIASLSLLALSLSFSIMLIKSLILRIFVLLSGIAVAIHLVKLPTKKNPEKMHSAKNHRTRAEI